MHNAKSKMNVFPPEMIDDVCKQKEEMFSLMK